MNASVYSVYPGHANDIALTSDLFASGHRRRTTKSTRLLRVFDFNQVNPFAAVDFNAKRYAWGNKSVAMDILRTIHTFLYHLQMIFEFSSLNSLQESTHCLILSFSTYLLNLSVYDDFVPLIIIEANPGWLYMEI